MKRMITIIFFFFSFNNGYSQAYSKEDTTSIYKILTTLPNAINALWYNTLGHGVDIYDFDWNDWDWAKRLAGENIISDTLVSVTTICFNPIQYQMPLLTYLADQGIKADTAYLYNQIRKITIDSLSKYIPVTFKFSNHPTIWINSDQKKLFRNDKAVYFSKIIFSIKNVAFVKVDYISGRRKSSYNSSEIIILKKENSTWRILTYLPQSFQNSFFPVQQN